VPQIAIRLSDAELAELDRMVAGAEFASRAEAVRSGVALLSRQLRERAIELSYRQGYDAHPLTDDERRALDAAAALAADLS
jgi:Arc/MetJ-type ribon-helix-helix transcriptional regulator